MTDSNGEAIGALHIRQAANPVRDRRGGGVRTMAAAPPSVAGARFIVALLSSPLRRAKSQSGGGGGDEMRDRRIAVARAVQRERGARAAPEQTRGKDGVAVWAARKVA